MRKQRLLMIGGRPPPFQGQSIAFESAIDAARKNFEVQVIDFSNREKPLKRQLHLLKFLLEVPYRLLRFRPEKVYFLCSRTVLGGLRDIYVLALCKFCKVEVYNHLHGSDFVSYLDSLSRMHRRLVTCLFRAVKRHAVLIDGMQEQLLPLAPVEKIRVVENFFQPFNWDRSSPKFSNGTKVVNICYLSSICESKGVFDLIDAFKLLPFHRYEFKLSIAGAPISDSLSDASQNKLALKDKIKNCENIEYLGELNSGDKYELLSRSHIFCLPSTYRSEAVPLSIIEAMAAGCVIVVYNHKYLPRLVVNELNGTVVSPNTPAQLASAMEELAKNFGRCRKISEFNISHAQSVYSEEKYQRSLLEFIGS